MCAFFFVDCPQIAQIYADFQAEGTVAAFTALAVIAFYFLLFTSAKRIGPRFGPRLQDIEASGPQ